MYRGAGGIYAEGDGGGVESGAPGSLMTWASDYEAYADW